MKVSKKEASLLLALLGIVFLFCAYRFCYLKVNEEAEKMNVQCSAMESEIAQYEAWIPQKDTLQTDTANMEYEIRATLNEFPSNVLYEDLIKFAYEADSDSLEKYTFINSMGFNDPEEIYSTEQNGELYPIFSLYQTQTSVGMNCSYSALKGFVSKVYQQNNRKSIDSISVTMDEGTGRLHVNLAMSSYHVTGTDKPYAAPSLIPVRIGTDNIFGAIEVEEVEEVAQ